MAYGASATRQIHTASAVPRPSSTSGPAHDTAACWGPDRTGETAVALLSHRSLTCLLTLLCLPATVIAAAPVAQVRVGFDHHAVTTTRAE